MDEKCKFMKEVFGVINTFHTKLVNNQYTPAELFGRRCLHRLLLQEDLRTVLRRILSKYLAKSEEIFAAVEISHLIPRKKKR